MKYRYGTNSKCDAVCQGPPHMNKGIMTAAVANAPAKFA